MAHRIGKLTALRAATIGVLACGLAAAGCSTVNTVERAEPQADAQVVDDQRIEPDRTLAGKAAVTEVRETRVNGLLKVQVGLLNTTSKRRNINYRFEWVDDAGMTVDTNMSRWSRVSLAGKESVWVGGIAPTPRVVDFRLKLLEPGS